MHANGHEWGIGIVSREAAKGAKTRIEDEAENEDEEENGDEEEWPWQSSFGELAG